MIFQKQHFVTSTHNIPNKNKNIDHSISFRGGSITFPLLLKWPLSTQLTQQSLWSIDIRKKKKHWCQAIQCYLWPHFYFSTTSYHVSLWEPRGRPAALLLLQHVFPWGRNTHHCKTDTHTQLNQFHNHLQKIYTKRPASVNFVVFNAL